MHMIVQEKEGFFFHQDVTPEETFERIALDIHLMITRLNFPKCGTNIEEVATKCLQRECSELRRLV